MGFVRRTGHGRSQRAPSVADTRQSVVVSKASSLLLLGGVLVAVLVAGALVWEPWRTGTETEPKSTVPLSTVGTRFEGAPVPSGKTAPDFTLKTADGTALRLSAQKGKLVLITFLYTRCRDVCPLIATKLDSIARDLGKDARSVRILAISVDPKGDTASAVRAYDRSHGLGPEFRWLIGTRTELYPVWRAYNVGVTGEDTDTVVHTAPVLLLDRRGRPRVYYQQPMSRRAIEHDLRLLLGR